MRLRLPFALPLILWVTVAAADTGYTNDEFEITLRSGESTGHSIVRMLTTGTRVEVLGSSSSSGYSQVRTDDGRLGYVLTRFISDKPAARDRLAWTQGQFDKLKKSKTELDKQFAALKAEKGSTDSQRSRLESRNNELTRELQQIRLTSANALNIDRENKELNAMLAQSEQTIAKLNAENEALAARSAQWWFVLGGGAVLLGILLGFVLPRIRWQKRSKWGDL